MTNERAISDTVSSILIIFLVVALAIVVVIFVFGVNIFQQKSAFISPDFSRQVVGGKDVIVLFHQGGDTAYLNSSNQLYVMSVWVDTTFGIFRALPLTGVDKFGSGTSFYIFYNSTSGLFNVTDNVAGLTGAAAAMPADVTGVHLVDENAHLLIVQWGAPGMSAPGLSVISVTPALGINNTLVLPLAINGTGFYPGTKVKLNRTGVADIVATGVSVVSSTRITCTVNINNIPAGSRNVVVTVPDGTSAVLVNGFMINPNLPAPTVSGISNATGYRGWPVIERITGTNFVSGATALLNRTATPDIPATSCTFISAGQILCSFDLQMKAASPPSYNVVVTNPDAKSGMRAGLFTLSNPAPTVTSSTPSSGNQAVTVAVTNLLGTNFQPGATVDYYRGGYRINLTGVSVVSRTQITGTLQIPPSAPAGAYTVSVTNPNGTPGTRSAFTVNSTTPTITARLPTSGNRGWPVTMTIDGTNFISGASVNLNRTGFSDIVAAGVTVVSPTRITCIFDLLNAPAGAWNMVVTNPDGRGAVRANYFSVNNPAPTVPAAPAFSPATGARGTTGLVIAAPGTLMQPGMAIALTRGTTTITAYNVNVVSPTQVTFTIDIPSGATTGLYSVQYSNAGGGTGSRTNRFTVM